MTDINQQNQRQTTNQAPKRCRKKGKQKSRRDSAAEASPLSSTDLNQNHPSSYIENNCSKNSKQRWNQNSRNPRKSVLSQDNNLSNVASGCKLQPKSKIDKRHNARDESTKSGLLSPAALQVFLADGLDKIRANEGTRNSFIKHLASDEGLEVVRQLLETNFSTSYSVIQPTFEGHCIPFLTILSGDTTLKALSLEKEVYEIYSFIYGLDGDRAPPFLRRILDCLETSGSDGRDDNGFLDRTSWNSALLMTTTVFLKILRFKQKAILNKELETISRRLPQLIESDVSIDNEHLDLIRGNILSITGMLNAGAEVPIEIYDQPHEIRANTSKLRSTENENIDFPGNLSFFGARHDNDRELISDISILPTVSEILSHGRSDFLPTKLAYEEPSHHHQFGAQRLIDIQFRLLREDTIGRMRDASRFILKNWDELTSPSIDWQIKRTLIRKSSAAPVRLYFGANIQKLRCTDFKYGLEVIVEFDQPRMIRSFTQAKRQQWWRKSQDLRESKAIVALIDGTTNDTNLVFFVVSKRNVSGSDAHSESHKASPSGHIDDLSSHAQRAAINLRLIAFAEPSKKVGIVEMAMKSLPNLSDKSLLLVEFPNIVYKHFEGILRCLKYLHQNPTQLPFGKWLAPKLKGVEYNAQDSDINSLIPAPAYLINKSLDLSACLSRSVKNNNATDMEDNQLTFTLDMDPDNITKTLAKLSTLDIGQAKAMVSAFRHEIALTQGPPGCGKSYIGLKMVQCLLQNKEKLGLGPIICICYTGHALDQFIGELLNLGITNIARIGGQSYIPKIQELELDAIRSRKAKKSPGLERQKATNSKELRVLVEKINKICVKLENNSTAMVRSYLEEKFPAKLQEIDSSVALRALENEEEGCDSIDRWISDTCIFERGDGELSIDELSNSSLLRLNRDERVRLYLHWHQYALDQYTEKLRSLMRSFAETKAQRTALFHEADKELLGKVDVLGLTTVGLANNSDLIRGMQSKVMVCEEAGEVLEAHILTALIPSIQHAIFIGDHLQLRPKISVAWLSKEHNRGRYNFDESLFERLANATFNKNSGTDLAGQSLSQHAEYKQDMASARFPIGQLEVQRRMHPDIAKLVRETLYPNLQDYDKTSTYPEVAGMKHRLFWLDHRNHEDSSDSSDPIQMMSKKNTWEARMVLSLVTYLARQGVYGPGEIAVLTPYVSQMRLLLELFEDVVDYEINERDMEDLEISDEIEEVKGTGKKPQIKKSKILDRIRIATVDNFQGEEATVIIVSLVRSNDRQECGFLKTSNRINVLLSRAKHGMYIIGDASTSMHIPMWRDVITIFEKGKNIGPKFQLHCPRHPEKRTFVGSPKEFENQCPEGGCSEKCGLRLPCGHTCEVKCHPKLLHERALCFKDCTRPRDCGHACRRRCMDPCGTCAEKIFNIELPCTHKAAELRCYEKNNLKQVLCREFVDKRFPNCGHEAKINCLQSRNPNFPCMQDCKVELACGHLCPRKCSVCTESGTHGECVTVCGKDHKLCQHSCVDICHEGRECSPCTKPCEAKCKHGKCPNKCGEPCIPCAEICGWECVHTKEKCQMPCSVPCDLLPCDKRCEKMLRCGHRCPSICGEDCPASKYCRECAAPDILGWRADLLMISPYQEIDLEDDPIVLLNCGHFYTMSSLDGHLELNKHYCIDEVGKKRVLLNGDSMKGCPDCRGPIRDINRYNRVFKAVLLDELTRSFAVRSRSEYLNIVQQLHNLESGIEVDRRELLAKLAGRSIDENRIAIKKYKEKTQRIMLLIQKFQASVSKTEQPLGRVHDLYIAAFAQRGDGGGQTFDFDKSIIQTGHTFRGKCLEAKAKWVTYCDWHKISTEEAVSPAIRQSLRDTLTKPLGNVIGDTKNLSIECRKADLPRHEIEARVYHALFSILSIKNAEARGVKQDVEADTKIRKKEKGSLEECEALCRKYPGTTDGLKKIIEEAKKMVRGETFYSRVTSEEESMVVAAMAAQFSGTGHWYYCVNGHPFTIGECGMPMEEARCPECRQPIGGQNHAAVSGVRSAIDIEVRHRVER